MRARKVRAKCIQLVLQMLEHILTILEENKESLESEIVDGFNIIRKTFGKMRENWQSYVLTPVSIILGRSNYHIYAHVTGVRIPKIPVAVSESIREIVPWCETTCNQRYRERCLVRTTISEIDAIIMKNKNVCFLEHATKLGGLCWDMVKLFKISSSQSSTACLFLTWYDPYDERHKEYATILMNLGKRLFSSTIGEDNWAIIFIPFSVENGVLSVYDLEFHHKNSSN